MRTSTLLILCAIGMCAGAALVSTAMRPPTHDSGVPVAGGISRGVFCSSEEEAQAVAHARRQPGGIERTRRMVAMLQGLAGNYRGNERWCSWAEYTIAIVGERRGEGVWELVVYEEVVGPTPRRKYPIRMPRYFVADTEAAEMPASVAYEGAYGR